MKLLTGPLLWVVSTIVSDFGVFARIPICKPPSPVDCSFPTVAHCLYDPETKKDDWFCEHIWTGHIVKRPKKQPSPVVHYSAPSPQKSPVQKSGAVGKSPFKTKPLIKPAGLPPMMPTQFTNVVSDAVNPGDDYYASNSIPQADTYNQYAYRRAYPSSYMQSLNPALLNPYNPYYSGYGG